jgi:hypothetical protein
MSLSSRRYNTHAQLRKFKNNVLTQAAEKAIRYWNNSFDDGCWFTFIAETSCSQINFYCLFLTAIGLTPGGIIQYIFTHKQYTENTERNIHNNKKKKWGKRIWEKNYWVKKLITDCDNPITTSSALHVTVRFHFARSQVRPLALQCESIDNLQIRASVMFFSHNLSLGFKIIRSNCP